jgi:Ca-activated chloride channel family protein
MKLKTVSLCAGAAMMLSSVTVWSITPAGGFGSRVPTPVTATGVDLGDPSAAITSWKFEDGSTLRVEGRLGHAAVATSGAAETFVYLDVTGAQTTGKGAPMNLSIVIDRSGSMRGKRMQNALEAATGMVRRLRDGDVVSVIAYDTRADTMLASTTIDASSRDRAVQAINSIVPAGDTCISCGLEAGMDALRGRDGMVKRILLLSDGEATAGVRDVEGFRTLGVRARDMECAISTIGVDVDYNERIMSTIAVESNGRHHFVDNLDSTAGLTRIFDAEIQSLTSTVASNADMRIDLAPGVEVVQVFDRAFRREGSSVVVPFGTFAAGENKTVLMKVRLPRTAQGLHEVAKVRLGFQDLASRSAGESKGQLSATLVNDPSQASELDPLVAARLSRSETAASLREANERFRAGDVAGARAALARSRSTVDSRRAAAASAAPAEAKPDLDEDFNRQNGALAEAEEVFATPPSPAAGPPQAQRPGRSQVKKNESRAADMGF